MAMKRYVPVLTAVLLLAGPGHARADRCGDLFDQAAARFDAAQAAGKSGDYDGAARIYGEAEKIFQQVSVMRDCAQPQISITAARNMGLCRSNAGRIRQGLEKMKAQSKEAAEAEAFNQATGDYNLGVEAFNNKQWDEASDALESAAAVWESIASDKTENGRLAAQYALKARKMAKMAREYKYQ